MSRAAVGGRKNPKIIVSPTYLPFFVGCNKYFKIQKELILKYGMYKFLDLQHKQSMSFYQFINLKVM